MYTIVPHEKLFEDADKTDYKFSDIVVDGISMQVQYMGEAQAKIIRLYSFNMEDYLNPKYAPGSVIRFAPMSTEEPRGI